MGLLLGRAGGSPSEFLIGGSSSGSPWSTTSASRGVELRGRIALCVRRAWKLCIHRAGHELPVDYVRSSACCSAMLCKI